MRIRIKAQISNAWEYRQGREFMRMPATQVSTRTDVVPSIRLIFAISFLLLLTPPLWASEEDATVPDNQQFLEALLKQSGMTPEQLEAAGVTPEQMQQITEAINQAGGMGMGAAIQQAEEEKRAAEFEATTAGFGTAIVSFRGEQHKLPVTTCEYRDNKGSFTIGAQKGRNPEDGSLNINSQAGSNSTISFWLGYDEYTAYVPGFDFDGQNLAWDGSVDTPDGKTPLSVSLTCKE